MGKSKSSKSGAKSPFVSPREANMRPQHFYFDPEVFDSASHADLVALETILVLNRGLDLGGEFSYRGSVFLGSEEATALELHWLALLMVDPSSGRMSFQLHPCQTKPVITERELVSRIVNIRTGYEDNPASRNSAQTHRLEIASKLVADWQMPVSMVTLAVCNQSGPTPLNLRLFAPDKPEMVYNTMALHAWRMAIAAA